MAQRPPIRTTQPGRPLTNQESLDQLRTWFLPDERIFSTIRFHGNTKWTPSGLAWLALCWVWSEARHLCYLRNNGAFSSGNQFHNSPLQTTRRVARALRTIWVSVPGAGGHGLATGIAVPRGGRAARHPFPESL